MTLDEFKELELPASLMSVGPSKLGLPWPDAPTFRAGTHVRVKRAADTANDSGVRWQNPTPDMIAFAICDGWSWSSRGGYCLEPGPEMAKVLAVLEPVEIAPPTENASW
jgi:hypothetical protein